jgi:hypothetical protein
MHERCKAVRCQVFSSVSLCSLINGRTRARIVFLPIPQPTESHCPSYHQMLLGTHVHYLAREFIGGPFGACICGLLLVPDAGLMGEP